MIPLDIILDVEGRLPELADAEELELMTVGGLARGCGSGRASVMLVLKDKSGRVFYAQTTLRLFAAAGRALEARHPDPGGN